ncbi:hypothetical protein Bca52824_074398 [Brassica carinata]|uniref:Uncharacterized protein n=1 Tax=Brassica carinata TaxID=52824 RepID=A0A8X7TVE1_BRACI|nr:hypothetical protein Bca52824_074398 [Brassica carinata]
MYAGPNERQRAEQLLKSLMVVNDNPTERDGTPNNEEVSDEEQDCVWDRCRLVVDQVSFLGSKETLSRQLPNVYVGFFGNDLTAHNTF